MKRCGFGDLVDELFERGLEIGLAGAFIINGITVLDVRPNGEPLAPFLSSSLNILSPVPATVAFCLIAMGLLYLVLLMVDMRRSLIPARVLVALLSGVLYSVIAAAILTGIEPKTAALRYIWSGVLSMLCFVGTFRIYLAEIARKRGQ